MNLNANPTIEQLRALIRPCDDDAGDHLLWVSKMGDVQLSQLRRGQSSIDFEKAHPEMQVRCETFLAGNEYVGPEAADDTEWVTELFDRLQHEWLTAKGGPKVACLALT